MTYFSEFAKLLNSPNISIEEIDKFFKKRIDFKDITEKELFELHLAPLKYFMNNKNLILNLDKFLAVCIANYLKADFDYITCITGTEGKGKSTLALYLIHHLKKLGIDFSWKNLVMRYTSTSSVEELLKLRRNSLWFDEAKIYFDKRESMTRERIRLNQEITASRGLNNAYFLCLGDIDEIDIYFRERRVRSLLIIPDRKIFIHLNNLGIVGMGQDRFRLDYFNYVVLKMPRIDYNKQISLLASLPSCYGVGLFKHPLQSEFSKEYITYKKFKDISSKYIAPIKHRKEMPEIINKENITLTEYYNQPNHKVFK